MKLIRKAKVFLQYFKSPRGKMMKYYIILAAFLAGMTYYGYIFIYSWPETFKKYEIQGVEETNVQEYSGTVTYSYYLDYSPSMEGFISNSGGVMDRLTIAIRSTNNGQNGTGFYRCNAEVISCNADIFFEAMSNPDQIRGDYNRIRDNGTLQEIDNIDLAKIFSHREFVRDSERLNVIITDLNFYDNLVQSTAHDERMNAFARGLANAAGNANISIYRLRDDYNGIGIDEVDLENGARKTSDNATLFLFVFSENTVAYEEYIRKLELYMEQEGIANFNKLEIRNDFLQDNHYLVVDDAELYAETTTKINFNYNNKLIRNRKNNEIGLYRIVGNNRYATFQGNVAGLELDMFNQEGQEFENESLIGTVVKTMYPYGLMELREYTGIAPVQVVSTGVAWDQNKCYLNVGIEYDTAISLPRRAFLNQNYFIVEIQFFMEKPDYKVPQWVVELDTNEEALDLEKKRKITELVERLLTEKEACFAEKATEYEKYMGSLAFYISY